MDTILQILIQYAAELIALIIITAIGVLGTMILNKLNSNHKLQNIANATNQVISAAQETVRRLQQVFVETWKESAEDGKLTPEQIEELKQMTQDITIEQLGQPILDLLAAAKVDVSALITNAAEAYINQLKGEG